jgi:hypothetical protein
LSSNLQASFLKLSLDTYLYQTKRFKPLVKDDTARSVQEERKQ